MVGLVCSVFLFLFITMLLSGSVFSVTPVVIHPIEGTTIDGNLVYAIARLAAGDRVQTGTGGAKVTVDGMELEIAPNTLMVIGVPLIFDRGSVVVRSGTLTVNKSTSITSLTAGQSAHAAFPDRDGALPDAPSATRCDPEPAAPPLLRRHTGAAPAAGSRTLGVNANVANGTYWVLQDAMLSSSIVAIELTHRCLEAGACRFVPDTFHRRAFMYSTGLPAVAGIYYFSYYLKKEHHRWWFVPGALVMAGEIVVSVHAAKYQRSGSPD
jgi:hypothetical protein